MKNLKKRFVLERISGVVERSRARAAATQYRKFYYGFRRLLREKTIPDYLSAVADLDFHRISFSVDNRYGFKWIKIGVHAPLLFDSHGKYAGHESVILKHPIKSGASGNFLC